jgi:hypothetical protein
MSRPRLRLLERSKSISGEKPRPERTYPNKPAALDSIRRGTFLVIFLFGAISTGAELLLLGHTESLWQLAPLLLIAISLAALIFHATTRRGLSRSRGMSVRVFQVIMLFFVISSFVGIWQHYQAKAEFKLETNPDLGGMELLWEAITGAAVPPVLAPGMMIQLGLLGLAYTYRHPALINSTKMKEPANTGE